MADTRTLIQRTQSSAEFPGSNGRPLPCGLHVGLGADGRRRQLSVCRRSRVKWYAGGDEARDTHAAPPGPGGRFAQSRCRRDLPPGPPVMTRGVDRNGSQTVRILTKTCSQLQNRRQRQLVGTGSMQLPRADGHVVGDGLPRGSRRHGYASLTVALALCPAPAGRVAVVLRAPAPF